jgi:putative membrane protein
MNKLIKFLALGGLIWTCAQYMSGIQVEGFYYAIIAAIVLSVINTLIRPILQIISLPITILTFGLFSFAITAFTVEIMDYFVGGISVASFWWALLLGLVVSFANSSVDRFLNRDKYTNYKVID